MEFDNAFEVPLPPAEAFRVLLDIPRIAPCMPGAELTDQVDDRTFRGRLNVRLGPVALSFAGTVKFDDVDSVGHTARATAQAADAKGRGAAGATATFTVEPAGAGTRVKVHTDLKLSGAVAQYGRGTGIIKLTAEQIVRQFADNLKAQLARDQTRPPPLATVAEHPAAASTAATAPPAPARPIAGLALIVQVMLALVRKLLGRR